MARPRPDKATPNPSSKSKLQPRKREKPDLCGWFTDDVTDQTDISPWMARREDGETRKGKQKPNKDKSDPRAAPPFNKFLWASKSLCKAIDNLNEFAQESLHEHFLGRLQVRLKQVNSDATNRQNGKLIDRPKSGSNGLGKSASSVLDIKGNGCPGERVGVNEHLQEPASHRCQSATTKRPASAEGGKERVPVRMEEYRETEVTRLKRLIAIARRYRQEASERGAQIQNTEFDNPYSSYISISSEVSDATGDSGVSLSSLQSHLAEVDGIWALEYINTDSDEGNPTAHEDQQPVKFSYTQGNKLDGRVLATPEKTVTILCDNNFSRDIPPTQESTPFITALRNYHQSQRDVEGIKPMVRSVKSARSRTGKNDLANTPSSGPSSGSVDSQSKTVERTAEEVHVDTADEDFSEGVTCRPKPGASCKVQRINIIVPSRNPDLSGSESLEASLSPSHPANIILQKLRENGINATATVSQDDCKPVSSSRVSSAVFPIGEILPVLEGSVRRATPRTKQHNRDSMAGSCSSDNLNITANDLLMHRGDTQSFYTGERYYVVRHPQKVLGPPPFRPMTNKTPLHRARDTSRKRMYGHSFAQETQDLYQKLIIAKNGVGDHRHDLTSGRRGHVTRNV